MINENLTIMLVYTNILKRTIKIAETLHNHPSELEKLTEFTDLAISNLTHINLLKIRYIANAHTIDSIQKKLNILEKSLNIQKCSCKENNLPTCPDCPEDKF